MAWACPAGTGRHAQSAPWLASDPPWRPGCSSAQPDDRLQEQPPQERPEDAEAQPAKDVGPRPSARFPLAEHRETDARQCPERAVHRGRDRRRQGVWQFAGEGNKQDVGSKEPENDGGSHGRVGGLTLELSDDPKDVCAVRQVAHHSLS